MGGSKFLLRLAVASLLIATTSSQNLTAISANNVQSKVGWQNGPNLRGTITLLWGCLSTVVACTWTILHLNVPGRTDDTRTKILRKTKWMIITILFPEFVFSKSVCELQMALDDLHAMKEKEHKITWKVEFGHGLKCLHMMFHLLNRPLNPCAGDTVYHGTVTTQKTTENTTTHATTTGKIVTHPSGSSYDPTFLGIEDLSEDDRKWTLTHSYFANMGGLQRYQNSRNSVPLSAHALVNCCVGSDHDPLPTLALQKEDIEDKANADWLVKSFVVLQISWLLLSVIVRAAKKLPISQLEICVTAFAVLAIATYIANWSKPKDIDLPVRFRIIADTYACEASKYHAESFFKRLLMPSTSRELPKASRVANDFVRLDGFVPSMAIMMAISTMLFGGLHCLAWYFEFPTETELMIWMIASVASATIPTAALLVNMLVLCCIRRIVRKWSHEFFRKHSFTCRARQVHEAQSALALQGGERKDQTLRAHEGFLQTDPYDELPVFSSTSELLAKHLLALHINLINFSYQGTHYQNMIASYEEVLELKHKFTLHQFDALKRAVRPLLSEKGLSTLEVHFLFLLLWNESAVRFTMAELHRKLLICDRASRYITIIGGILYAVVRLMLLALAFAALRSVPEGVYITTWTRFLPSIS